MAGRYRAWWAIGATCVAACGGRIDGPGLGSLGPITGLSTLGTGSDAGPENIQEAAPPCAETDCDGACVSLGSDPLNCGACHFSCMAGQSCQAGACVEQCSAGLAKCGGSCADVATDAFNCGSCGTRCSQALSCVDATCTCPTGQTLCGGACRDLTADPRNCGGCGVWCWTPGSLFGLRSADGGLATDPASYGATEFVVGTNACVGGQCVTLDLCSGNYARCSFEGASCVDTTTDINCGGCGIVCRGGSHCVAQKCTCAEAGLAYCDGSCLDVRDSDANCGGCGIACPSGASCSSGSCQRSACPPGQSLCDGACVDLQTSPNHCGLCDQVCGGNLVCIQGQCACPSGTSDCAGSCVDTDTDNQNCGACENTCSGTCSGGACR
jgi:hypothetical protein